MLGEVGGLTVLGPRIVNEVGLFVAEHVKVPASATPVAPFDGEKLVGVPGADPPATVVNTIVIAADDPKLFVAVILNR